MSLSKLGSHSQIIICFKVETQIFQNIISFCFLYFSKRRTPVSLKYFLDKNSFLREPPFSQIISDIPGIEEMDFDQHVRQQKGMHFQLYL